MTQLNLFQSAFATSLLEERFFSDNKTEENLTIWFAAARARPALFERLRRISSDLQVEQWW
jgi:hypothetical protein